MGIFEHLDKLAEQQEHEQGHVQECEYEHEQEHVNEKPMPGTEISTTTQAPAPPGKPCPTCGCPLFYRYTSIGAVTCAECKPPDRKRVKFWGMVIRRDNQDVLVNHLQELASLAQQSFLHSPALGTPETQKTQQTRFCATTGDIGDLPVSPLSRQIQTTTQAVTARPDADGLIEWFGPQGERVTEYANRLGRRPPHMYFEQWWRGSPLLDYPRAKRKHNRR